MKKRIDEYYKRKLDVPQAPPKNAWENITNELDKEKGPKVIPLWFRLSGVAVALLLVTGISYYTYNNSQLNTPIKENNSVSVSQSKKNIDIIDSNANNGNDEIIKENLHNYQNSQSEQQVTMPNSSLRTYSNHQNNKKSKTLNYIDVITNQNPVLFLVDPSIQKRKTNELIAELYKINPYEKNPFQEFLEPNSVLKQIDEENALVKLDDKILEESSSEKTKNKKRKQKINFDRFEVSAYASPMAYNTYEGKSMLSDNLNRYNSENSVAISYGTKIAYAVSSTVKIRTGIAVIGLEQSTYDVPFLIDAGSNTVASLKSSSNVKYLNNLLINTSLSGGYLAGSLETEENISPNGTVRQQINYIEVPLEAEVKLYNTDVIGISATGGASTYVLTHNKLLAETGNATHELGKADNLNDVSFSANAGIRMHMNLTEKIKLNVEPNIKYMVNQVSDVEKLNPYIVGVNAGVSLSF